MEVVSSENAASRPSSSWVVDMETMLERTDHDPAVAEMVRWNRRSIYRVPEGMKQQTKSEAYRPLFVSLGPFHHGDRWLVPMEEHKRRAVLHLVRRARRQFRDFVAEMEAVAGELLDAYGDDLGEEWRSSGVGGGNGGRDRFLEVMLTDGCFLLEMMRTRERVLRGKNRVKEYAANDPIFSIHGFYFVLPDIQSDLLLMENQLPLLVLQRILVVEHGISAPSVEDINKMVLDFLGWPLHEDTHSLGLHPLDLVHKSFRNLQPPVPSVLDQWEVDLDPVHSAVELSDAGVHFKESKTKHIDFGNGVLRMPLVKVYDGTEKTFLNLVAFERLQVFVGHDVTDYLIFMDNIISSERDVALLRSKGLIKSGLGSDKEVADLFNTLSKGAVMSPFCRLLDVQRKMNEHCRKPWNRWRATFEHTYLSNPYVFISLLAGVVVVICAVLQVVYGAVSYYDKK